MDILDHGCFRFSMDSFQEFIEHMLNLSRAGNKDRYIFRGQRQSNWKLQSTLARTGIIEKSLEEHKQLFLKALAGRRGNNPIQLTDNEIWALGQHHGLHTPLLDWTTSPYVALFFAYAMPNPISYNSNRVVFALNIKRIKQKLDQSPNDSIGLDIIQGVSDENHRMRSQGGLFTRVKPLEVDIEQWIREIFPKMYNHSTLVRFELPEILRRDILQQLDWMNVNYLSLFPDLHGSAMHANLHFEIEK